jgi:hypothetical protein
MAGHGWALGAVVSVGSHGAAWWLSPAHPPMVAPPPEPTLIEMPIEPPPEAVPPAPEPPPTAAPVPVAPVEAKVPAKAAPTPPAAALPAPAQAGKTLVAEDAAPAEVADFTMVQGLADSYAGGTTTALGTSDRAVHGATGEGRAAATGPGSAVRPAPAVPTAPVVDLSKPASPAGGDWSCSRLFPTDPDAPDQAAVTLVVEVEPNGRPRSIRIARDPGFGFGEAARRCAQGQSFSPALGVDGAPVLGRTRPFVVRFSR